MYECDSWYPRPTSLILYVLSSSYFSWYSRPISADIPAPDQMIPADNRPIQVTLYILADIPASCQPHYHLIMFSTYQLIFSPYFSWFFRPVSADLSASCSVVSPPNIRRHSHPIPYQLIFPPQIIWYSRVKAANIPAPCQLISLLHMSWSAHLT
jgi:hypothetical protein